ncbi:16901_t:CDS:2 [Acaulospora colombiana]|uniref:16901_t:CDS:1 n=1 Tax=Acaulospora colombiana TaxID=27376 RepID=A0ACA9L4X1_9GLOM|nr:16901_t:CDS:2 [Acaulospora colombiana]
MLSENLRYDFKINNYSSCVVSKDPRPKRPLRKNKDPNFIPVRIQMPSASEIKIEEFINRSNEKIGKKGPNGFFVYRRVFAKELLRLNYKLEMTNVSRMAGDQWNNEDVKIREEYKTIASMIDKKLKELRRGQPKAYHYRFIYYDQQEPPSPPPIEPIQQCVIDEELSRCLYECRVAPGY